jgi:hypothetical protein
MDRIRDGFRLVGQSWTLVRREPVILGLVALATLVNFLLIAVLYLLIYRRAPEMADFRFPRLLLIYPAFIVSGSFASLGTGTVIALAMQRLEGTRPSLREAFRLTLRKWPKLVKWNVLAGTVGLIINLIAEKLKVGGRIAAALAGVSWAVLTMLIVPVLLFEDRDVVGSVRRSSELIKGKWGEGVSGQASITGALALVLLPIMFLGLVLLLVDIALGITVMVVGFLGVMIVAGSLSSVFSVALYRFAVTGVAGGPFTDAQLDGTFVTREERKAPGRRAWRILATVFMAFYVVMKIIELTGHAPTPH